MTFHLRSEGDEGGVTQNCDRGYLPGRRNHKHDDPEMKPGLVCLRDSKGASGQSELRRVNRDDIKRGRDKITPGPVGHGEDFENSVQKRGMI